MESSIFQTIPRSFVKFDSSQMDINSCLRRLLYQQVLKTSQLCFVLQSNTSLPFKRFALPTLQHFKIIVLVVVSEHTNCGPELDHLC